MLYFSLFNVHVIVLSRTGSVNAEYEFPLPLCVCRVNGCLD